ncbi:CcmD family protein [Sphingobacteriales bacterium UPWRP_1]|nr:CcmD family protein [Sphingobacteriales bacterium UPWRP_1]
MVFILFALFAQAQQTGGAPAVEMAEQLRSSGKIYVVVVVLAIIFAGIIVFLVTIDRRLRKLENEQQQQ